MERRVYLMGVLGGLVWYEMSDVGMLAFGIQVALGSMKYISAPSLLSSESLGLLCRDDA